jgi:hypothetical protein
LNGTASLTKYFYQDEGLKSSTGWLPLEFQSCPCF